MNPTAKTPVQVLQEFLTKLGTTATYSVICNGAGTQAVFFKYEVSALNKTAIGHGKCKKEAKHEAARLLFSMLEPSRKLLPIKSEGSVYSPYDDTIQDNAVGKLQLFCDEYYLSGPMYKLIRDEGPPHSKLFTMKCTLSSFTFTACARTKKQAKHQCAAGLLNKLKSVLCSYIYEMKIAVSADNVNHDSEIELSNVINKLKEIEINVQVREESIALGVNVTDLYSKFKNSHCPNSNNLSLVKGKSEAELLLLKDPVGILNILADEFNCIIKTTELPSKSNIKIVSTFLISRPGWNFIGVGNDFETAKKQSVIKALKFIAIMSV